MSASRHIDGRQWQISGSGLLTQDTLICPCCENSWPMTYLNLRLHFFTVHLRRIGIRRGTPVYHEYGDILRTTTYQWKTRHGNVTPQALRTGHSSAHARELVSLDFAIDAVKLGHGLQNLLRQSPSIAEAQLCSQMYNDSARRQAIVHTLLSTLRKIIPQFPFWVDDGKPKFQELQQYETACAERHSSLYLRFAYRGRLLTRTCLVWFLLVSDYLSEDQ